jgi:hypothetical protein
MALAIGVAPIVVNAAPVPNPDPCVSQTGDAYNKCRFDRIEAAIPVATVTATVATTATVTVTKTATSTVASTSTTLPPSTGTWMSGASGAGVADGTFGTWRGTAVPMCVTWSDNTADNQLNSWQFNTGAEYDKWTGSCDWSPGAIYPATGESWQAASTGAYDARWLKSIQTVETKWKNKSRGTLYVRFAHEMNGNWMPWSVNVNQIEQFKQSWIRYANIVRAEFPEAKLVFNPNGDTSGQAYDWRKLWPGDQYVDVSTTDWYSNHWKAYKPDAVDQYGGPTGLAKHLEFAQQHGKPFAVPEWGNNLDAGDQPDYIAYMNTFFKNNAGTGAGQVLYEGYFNVIWNPNKFGLFPNTLAPKARDKYIELF